MKKFKFYNVAVIDGFGVEYDAGFCRGLDRYPTSVRQLILATGRVNRAGSYVWTSIDESKLRALILSLGGETEYLLCSGRCIYRLPRKVSPHAIKRAIKAEDPHD